MTYSSRVMAPRHRLALALIGGLLAVRLLVVLVSPLELYADEAQYWRWGQTLDWGYYSKPPMIAWVIRSSTSLFGDSEAAIRLLAPVLHSLAAGMLYLLSRQMFGVRAGLITLVAYLLMPGIVLSSTIISTDGVLFPFWCAALYLFWQLREGRAGWGQTLALGAAIGFGFLSKYAILYFGIGIALTALIDAPTRRAVISPKGAGVLAMALLILTPHIIWNIANAFETVGHTVDNASLGGDLFNLENIPKYIGDQMGVFGPVSFIGLIAGLVFMRGGRADTVATRENWLACFIVPVLVIILFQSVLSRAHANWAATAYPAACVLIGSVFVRANPSQRLWVIVAVITAAALQVVPEFTAPTRLIIGLCVAAALLAAGYLSNWRPAGLFWSGIGLHLALTAVMATLMLGPASWTGALGLDNSFKRTRGWQDLANQLALEAERRRPSAILVDEREIWHGIDYYARGRLPAPLILWRGGGAAKSFAEKVPLTDAIDDQVLIASYRPNYRPIIAAEFGQFTASGRIGVDLGFRSNGCPLVRELRLYTASDYAQLTLKERAARKFNGKTLDARPPCPPLAGDTTSNE
ncbi:MAG: glycosyltransferase family 39 protein [Pseudomonadota bacterium]